MVAAIPFGAPRTARGYPVGSTMARAAAVVGTILNQVNQGPDLIARQGISWLHLLISDLVPICVASYSAASSPRDGAS